MERVKVHDLHVRAIRNWLSMVRESLEDDLCRKYNVETIDQLNATDYDEIISAIQTFIAKERKWNIKT
jgi:hypothetical protein